MASFPKRQKLIELTNKFEFFERGGVAALMLNALYFVAFGKARDDFLRQRLVHVFVQFHQNVETLKCRNLLRIEQLALAAFDIANHQHAASRQRGQFRRPAFRAH